MFLDEEQRRDLVSVVKRTFPNCCEPEWRARQIESVGIGRAAFVFGKLRESDRLSELLACIEAAQKHLASLTGETRFALFLALQYQAEVSNGEQYVSQPLEALRRIIDFQLSQARPNHAGKRHMSKATERTDWDRVGIAYMCWQVWAREKEGLGQNGQFIDKLPPKVNANAKNPPFGLFVRDTFRACGIIDKDDLRLVAVSSAIRAIHKLQAV